FLKRLSCLVLRGADLRDEGLRGLAQSTNLSCLSVLDLSKNRRLGEAGLRALAGSPHLAGLRALALKGVPLTLKGAQALASSPSWPNLETLDLSETRLDAASVKA